MERILIVGCPGAGKSTLAAELAKKFNLPLIHLDKLFWLDGWVQRDKTEFDQLVFAELNKPKWIIDGNYARTLPRRLQYCDTVICLDFSRFACVWGVLKRIVTNYGKVRSDMGDNCPERFDREFLKYVWNFNKINRKKLLDRIGEADPSVSVILLRNRRAVKRFLKDL